MFGLFAILVILFISSIRMMVFMARQTLVGLGLLTDWASRSHPDTPHSVGLVWTSDRPVTVSSTPDSTQLSQDTDIDAADGIRTRNPITQWAVDPSPRTRGHWDRLSRTLSLKIYTF